MLYLGTYILIVYAMGGFQGILPDVEIYASYVDKHN